MKQKKTHTLRGFTLTREGESENSFSLFPNAVKAKAPRAFTLIEIMVATSIFAMVMMIAVGALLSLVQMNQRAQALNSVMNNVNAAVDTMTRAIRVGKTYHCALNYNDLTNLTLVADCAGTGGELFAFESATGSSGNPNDQIVYRKNGTRLERSLTSGVPASSWIAITAPEITVSSLQFFVVGSPKGDNIQPRVLIILKGTAPTSGGKTTSFTIQSAVVQRLLDL